MKKIISLIALSFMLLSVNTVFGADILISWDVAQGVDGYSLVQSVDNGTTWSTPQDVGSVTTATYTVPDSGLVLIRVGAYNSAGITWRLDAGIFYNGDWKPLLPPSGVGVQ